MTGGQIKFGRAGTTQLTGAVQQKDIQELEKTKTYWFPDYARARRVLEEQRKITKQWQNIQDIKEAKIRARTNRICRRRDRTNIALASSFFSEGNHATLTDEDAQL